MKNGQYIAERKFLGVDVNGDNINITVGIGIPYESKEYNSWACPVKIEGLYNKLADQHGIDSWQAVRLSQKLVASLLEGFIEKGGKIYLFDENDEITREEINEFF